MWDREAEAESTEVPCCVRAPPVVPQATKDQLFVHLDKTANHLPIMFNFNPTDVELVLMGRQESWNRRVLCSRVSNCLDFEVFFPHHLSLPFPY